MNSRKIPLVRAFLLAWAAAFSTSAACGENTRPGTLPAPLVYPPLTVREGEGLDIPLPPSGHPRLFLRASDIPALKQKRSAALLKASWEKLVERAAKTPGPAARADGTPSAFDQARLDAIEAKALLHVLLNDEKAGNDAVAAALDFVAADFVESGSDGCRELGRAVLAMSIVYDWCHALLTGEQKRFLIARMEGWAARMEFKWPALVQGSVVGHGVEAQLSRDMLACGVAVYDEKPEIYRRGAGRVFAEMIPVRNFVYTGTYHHQGSSYGHYRYYWEIFTTLIFARMGHPGTVSAEQGKVPYYWIYARRPDGQLLRNGDDYAEQFKPFGRYWNTLGIAYAASFYQDPLLMGEAVRQKQIGQDPLFDFLFIDPTVDPRPDLSGLPLTKYFPEPFGAMIARTGWEQGFDSDAVIAEMKIGVYNFANHQHLDAGSFQLYHKGPLAVPSGIYQGKRGAYGSDHFRNYYQRTIAHNSLLVHDPSETFVWHGRPILNDGGQRYPQDAREPENVETLLTGGYKTGEVLAHDFGPDRIKPDYSYLKGDVTAAYTDKVRNVLRSFVFLNLGDRPVPAALLVFDRIVSADPGFKKTWLLHCVEEPALAANITTISRHGRGYSGRLVNTTLLPSIENLDLKSVGGPGAEYTTQGVNFPQEMVAKDHSGDGVIWRVEASPKTPALTDTFFNVMQVMAHGLGESAPPVKRIETEHFVGARVADWAVFFSKSGAPVGEPVTFEIPGDEPVKVLITDLAKGSWRIVCEAAPQDSPGTMNNRAGVLYFRAKPGKYGAVKIGQARESE